VSDDDVPWLVTPEVGADQAVTQSLRKIDAANNRSLQQSAQRTYAENPTPGQLGLEQGSFRRDADASRVSRRTQVRLAKHHIGIWKFNRKLVLKA
jgi:hypothetical protein